MPPVLHRRVPDLIDETSSVSENGSVQEASLVSQAAWSIAIAPIKTQGLSIVMMHFFGSSGILGLIMLAYGAFGSIRSIYAGNQAFRPLEEQNGGKFILPRIVHTLSCILLLLLIGVAGVRRGLFNITTTHYEV